MTDPLASPLFCGRMLSATIFENVQKELVVDAVAAVVEPRNGELRRRGGRDVMKR